MSEQQAWKTMDRPAFDAWIASYPRPLERDVYGACEPPLVTWNDFTRAPYWPDSVVASSHLGGYQYKVLEDIEAPVVSDIKPDLDPLFDCNGVEVKEGDMIRMSTGFSITAAGVEEARYRLATVRKRDVGTNYEAWCPHDCANNLRGMAFEKV